MRFLHPALGIYKLFIRNMVASSVCILCIIHDKATSLGLDACLAFRQ